MSHRRCVGFLASIAALMLPLAPACAFDDAKYRRELRRVTTLDIAEPALVSAGS